MLKIKREVMSAVLLLFVSWFCFGQTAYAWDAYTNPDTGYEVIVEDDADLLTDEEEEELAELMVGITPYGSAVFKTISYNDTTTERYIKEYYADLFGSGSGTVFLIDMDNRNIWIHSNGAVYKIITNSYADTITDNVYTYASDEEYYECGYHVFEQIRTLLEGNKIAQPMKYISNTFLAVIMALFINYFVVKAMSVSKKPGEKELLAATRYDYKVCISLMRYSATRQNAMILPVPPVAAEAPAVAAEVEAAEAVAAATASKDFPAMLLRYLPCYGKISILVKREERQG